MNFPWFLLVGWLLETEELEARGRFRQG